MHSHCTVASCWMWLICSVQHMASVNQGFPRGNINHRAAKRQERLYHFPDFAAALLSSLSLTSATVLVLTACLLSKGKPDVGMPCPATPPKRCIVRGHPGCCSVGFEGLHWALHLENPFLFPPALPRALWLHFCSSFRHLYCLQPPAWKI